jgi:hypothetical protein
MGFYDNRCSLSGVSLWRNDAVLILLEPDGKAFWPVTLGVKGSCNRFGSIDGFTADANVSAICEYLRAKLESKELLIGDDYYVPKGESTAQDVEEFFQAFERNTSDGQENGFVERPLTPALICLTIWDGLVERSKVTGTPEEVFDRLFADRPIPREIYGKSLANVQKELVEQAAVSEFMVRHRIAWKPSEIYGQADLEEVRQFLSEAQKSFKASPEMLAALNAYEAQMPEYE